MPGCCEPVQGVRTRAVYACGHAPRACAAARVRGACSWQLSLLWLLPFAAWLFQSCTTSTSEPRVVVRQHCCIVKAFEHTDALPLPAGGDAPRCPLWRRSSAASTPVSTMPPPTATAISAAAEVAAAAGGGSPAAAPPTECPRPLLATEPAKPPPTSNAREAGTATPQPAVQPLTQQVVAAAAPLACPGGSPSTAGTATPGGRPAPVPADTPPASLAAHASPCAPQPATAQLGIVPAAAQPPPAGLSSRPPGGRTATRQPLGPIFTNIARPPRPARAPSAATPADAAAAADAGLYHQLVAGDNQWVAADANAAWPPGWPRPHHHDHQQHHVDHPCQPLTQFGGGGGAHWQQPLPPLANHAAGSSAGWAPWSHSDGGGTLSCALLSLPPPPPAPPPPPPVPWLLLEAWRLPSLQHTGAAWCCALHAHTCAHAH